MHSALVSSATSARIKQLAEMFTVLLLLSCAATSPIANKIETIKSLLKRDTFEWTALGDSYSSGVGAGNYLADAYRCLRYESAYPVLINGDARLPTGDHQFNNVVCSGSNTTEVELYQFFDEDKWAVPNRQYGS